MVAPLLLIKKKSDGSPFVIIQDLDFDNTLVHWIWKVHSGTAILHILVSLLIILLDLPHTSIISHLISLLFLLLLMMMVV